MVTEFEIRRRVASICASDKASHAERARALFHLADQVRHSAFQLARLSHCLLEEGKSEAAARMDAATQRLIETVAEVRQAATDLLHEDQDHPLGFGTAPCREAYPRWKAPGWVLPRAS